MVYGIWIFRNLSCIVENITTRPGPHTCDKVFARRVLFVKTGREFHPFSAPITLRLPPPYSHKAFKWITGIIPLFQRSCRYSKPDFQPPQLRRWSAPASPKYSLQKFRQYFSFINYEFIFVAFRYFKSFFYCLAIITQAFFQAVAYPVIIKQVV